MIGTLSENQMDRLLHNNVIGRIGMHADDTTYVVPVTYFYFDGYIYGHSTIGMKLNMLRKNPKICFEVDQIFDFAHWQSVILWGTFVELKGSEAIRGLQILEEGLSFHYISHTSSPEGKGFGFIDDFPNDQINSVVYRIDITKKTGRFEKRS